MDKTRALDKIRKCLALANSTNPGEAANAMRQAQALMRQHGVEQIDVDMSAVSEAGHPTTSSRLQMWEEALASLVADAMGCQIYLERGYAKKGIKHPRWAPECRMVYIGVSGAADMAAYAFKVLQRQCKTQRQAHVAQQPASLKKRSKSARGDAFALGWVASVRGLLDRFANSDQQDAVLASYMQAKYPNLKPQRKTGQRHKAGTRSDVMQGQLAGQSARLERGIGAAAGPALIGSNLP